MSRKPAVALFAALFAVEAPSFSQERPLRLTLVGTIDLGADAGASVSAFANLVFVGQSTNASGGGSVAIVDISNPSSPTKLGETPRYPGTSTTESRAVRIGRRVVLAVGLNGPGISTVTSPKGLKLFDVSNPAQPIELGFYDPGPGQIVPAQTFSGASFLDIAVTPDGRTLALLSTQGTEVVSSSSGMRPGIGDLQIVDITNPANPTLIGEWGVLDEPILGPDFLLGQQRGARADAFAERVYASRDGERVYLAYSDHGAMILDISNPSQPILLGHVGLFEADEEGAAFDVRPVRGGSTLLRSNLVRSNFQVRLSSNVYPESRTAGEAGDTPAIYRMPGGSIHGEVVFAGRGCPGDPHLADPNGKLALMTVAGCSGNLKTAGAQLAGAVGVILYDGGPALTIAGFDAQFPPGVGGTVRMPDNTTVTLSIPAIGVGQNTGRCLAQARDPSGDLLAVDCLPASPVIVHGSAVFQGFGRLDIFDVRNPADPVKLSTFATPNSIDINVALMNRFPNARKFFTANYVEAVGGLAFVSWENDGLRVIDISRSLFPQEIASWNGEGRPSSAPPIHAWQVVRHRDLILLNSLFDAVYILRLEPAAGLVEIGEDRDFR